MAAENPPEPGKVRILNQVSEVRQVKELAEIISRTYGSNIVYHDNPRKELAENELEVDNTGLRSLGFEPITLSVNLIDDVRYIAEKMKEKSKAGKHNDITQVVISMDEFYKRFVVPTTKPYSIEKKVNDFSFEWGIVNEKLTDTRRCLDIGGHIGIYAYEYSKIFDKVETFEPATKIFNLMNQNIHSIVNISMHNVGISDKNGTELMYENPVNTESNVVVSNETKNLVDSRWGNGKRWAGQIPVVIECRSIDSYQFTDVDFIKIDNRRIYHPSHFRYDKNT